MPTVFRAALPVVETVWVSEADRLLTRPGCWLMGEGQMEELAKASR